MGVFTLQIMGAFAELEKALIRERTVAGLAAAKLDTFVAITQALKVD